MSFFFKILNNYSYKVIEKKNLNEKPITNGIVIKRINKWPVNLCLYISKNLSLTFINKC